MTIDLSSFSPAGLAVVVGASGGIGRALQQSLAESQRFDQVIGVSRGVDGFDLTNEDSIERAAALIASSGLPLRLVLVATGLLHSSDMQPEKSWRQMDTARLARAFAINAIGPALVAKHFLPLLPKEGKSVFAALSARVGSIGDNHLGGWYGYRASKAALNQLIHTASIELSRTRPAAICVTLHPGTVATQLSAPFRSSGHEPVDSIAAAARLLRVINGLRPAENGLMIDHSGLPIPW